MEYKCNDCNKTYSGYQSLWIHNKKFHTKDNQVKSSAVQNASSFNQVASSINQVKSYDDQVSSSNVKLYQCRYCNKEYNIVQSRWFHEKSCKDKSKIVDKDLIIKKLEEENEQLKKNNQLVPVNSNINNTNNQTNNGVINKNHGTINNTLNSTNTINNNNNNTVTINKIGTEPIVFKTRDIKMIANDGMNGPITCVRQLNFDKKKPQNHSYCITSLEGDYCKAINHETQQPEMIPKNEVIDKVFESAYRFIQSVAEQIKEDSSLRDKLTKKEIKEINRIVANKNKFYEKKNRKTFYNSINSMGYNYKELVLSTWKLLKPLEENLITDPVDDSDSESNYDYEMKEVTEFPNIDDLSDDDSDEEVYTVKTKYDSDTDDDKLTIFDLIK